MKTMNARPLISLSIAAAFLALATTGVLLYLVRHDNTTAAVHTSFGAIFLVLAALHIRNNFGPLKTYSYKRGERPRAFVRKELWIALATSAALVAGILYQLPPLMFVYEWGNQLRNLQANIDATVVPYQHLETNPQGQGPALVLDVKKGTAFRFALFAVWIEDMSGQYIQTLYVSRAIGSSVFDFGKQEASGEWVPGIQRRPEALPYWGHQRGIQARDGLYLPDADTLVTDAVTAATPTESFKLRTRPDAPLQRFKIFLEVNQSFDWNDYFSADRFPDDKIYSGSGKNGQPSLVYTATIDLGQSTRDYALNPAGHGHPGGQDGTLEPDLTNITTGLEILEGATVRVVR